MSDGQSANRAEAGLLKLVDTDELVLFLQAAVEALCPAEGDRDEETFFSSEKPHLTTYFT